MTPSELLRAYAQIAERNPIATLTGGGGELQTAFLAFLRSTADANASGTDIMSDLMMLIARHFVAVSMAFHQGKACFGCIAGQALVLGNAIEAEILLNNSQFPQDPKGMH